MDSAWLIVGDVLEYHSHGELRWTLNVKDIIVIGEYTTNEGPIHDDYFFDFITAENGNPVVRSASFYSAGRDEVLGELQKRMGASIKPCLCNSVDWQSRVIWPPSLANTNYFTFAEIPPANVLQKTRDYLFGPSLEYFHSQAVRSYVSQLVQQKSVGKR